MPFQSLRDVIAHLFIQGAPQQVTKTHAGQLGKAHMKPLAQAYIAKSAALLGIPIAHGRRGVVNQGSQIFGTLANRGSLLIDALLQGLMDLNQVAPCAVQLHRTLDRSQQHVR